MSGLRPILIVEDDASLRATLAESLCADGEFVADAAESAAQAEAMLAGPDARYDAILLDIGLPDADGREFCARLSRGGRRMLVIMLTGATGEEDVVRGLEAGANDYVAKPFGVAELRARVRAQLRICDGSEDAVFSIGPFVFRPAAKLLVDTHRGRRIRLTDKERAILRFLHRAGGAVVSRQTLLNEVWGYNTGVTTHTLETHVYRLRQKLEAAPATPTLLVPAPGGGSRLTLAGAGASRLSSPGGGGGARPPLAGVGAYPRPTPGGGGAWCCWRGLNSRPLPYQRGCRRRLRRSAPSYFACVSEACVSGVAPGIRSRDALTSFSDCATRAA